jgi:hypothetical protein
MMEKQGIIKLSREFTISDSLEEIQFQVDGANTNYVQRARCRGISQNRYSCWFQKVLEIIAGRFGTNALDGFSNNLCKDMTKFTRPSTEIYRKYWRRGGISSPQELALMVLGSVAMTVVQNKDFGGLGNMVAGALGSAMPKPKSEPSKVYDLSKFGAPNVQPNIPHTTIQNTSSTSNTSNTIPPMPTVLPSKTISLKPPIIPSASWEMPSVASNARAISAVGACCACCAHNKNNNDWYSSSSVKRNRKQHSDESSIVL